jgi:hypothetical protein
MAFCGQRAGCDTKPHAELLNSKGGFSLVCCHQCPTEACDQRDPVVREPSGQCRLTRQGGDLTVRQGHDCQHQAVRELGRMVGPTDVNRG